MEERIGELIKTSAKYEALINALSNCSKLGYMNNLSFDSEQLSAVFQALEPEKYEARMMEVGGKPDHAASEI